MSVDWSDANVAILKDGLAAGLSYSQIAKRIPFCTRNGAIGKAKRLGLDAPTRASKPRHLQTRKTGDSGNGAMASAPNPHPRNGSPIYKGDPTTSPLQKKLDVIAANRACEPLPERPGELSATCTLLELRPHSCRWPIGDPLLPGFGFCGRLADSLYCHTHEEIAFTPVPQGKPRTGNELARSLRMHL